MNPPTPAAPTVKFTHAGVERTLQKHPAVRNKYRQGLITLEQISAASWYLRVLHADEKTGVEKERWFKLSALADADATREAKEFLKNRETRPNEFSAWLAHRDARRGLNFNTLAKEWLAAGLPFSRTHNRTADAAGRLREHIERALRWWGEKTASATTPGMMADFVVWRRTLAKEKWSKADESGPSFGSRVADLELAALSTLCQWAVSTERLSANPFADRERFCDAAAVVHCHEASSEGDDQFHRVLSWFFAPIAAREKPPTPAQIELDRQRYTGRVVVGAWLAFTALSGLRPGEHSCLLRIPAANQFPTDLRTAMPGLIYPMPDGSTRMKVIRSKGGQNPAIVIHPALRDFLQHYQTWLADYFPAGPVPGPLFPGLGGEGQLNGYLCRACAAVKVRHLRPHGFGRAYYVRVRRSQGLDDSTIAAELGQKTDGALIRSVYGDPQDPVGGNLHDWLPAEGKPAWHQLIPATAGNIINFGKL